MTETPFAPIRFDVGDPPVTVEFDGFLLVEPDPATTRFGRDAGAYWGVAATSKGRIAVYCAHVNERFAPHLTDYDDLDAAATDGVPEEIVSQAALAAGKVHPVRLDI